MYSCWNPLSQLSTILLVFFWGMFAAGIRLSHEVLMAVGGTGGFAMTVIILIVFADIYYNKMNE